VARVVVRIVTQRRSEGTRALLLAAPSLDNEAPHSLLERFAGDELEQLRAASLPGGRCDQGAYVADRRQ